MHMARKYLYVHYLYTYIYIIFIHYMGFKCAHVTDVFDSYKKSKKSIKAVNVDSSYDGDK